MIHDNSSARLHSMQSSKSGAEGEAHDVAVNVERGPGHQRDGRHQRWRVVPALALWALSSVAYAANLVPEPGFEFSEPQASPWRFDWYTENRGTLKFDDDTAYRGDKSLLCEISAKDQFAYWTFESLPVPEGVKYLKLSVWCRAKNVNGTFASMGLSFHDKDGYWFDHRLWMAVITQDTEWEKYEGFAKIPPNAVTMNVVGWANPEVHGTGRFWFDDLELVPAEELILPDTVFRDTTPAPRPDKTERDRGFILFSRDYTRVLFSGAVPRAKERVKELRISAAAGESEPAVLALYGLRDLRDVSVTVGSLQSETASLPGEVVDVRSVTFQSRAGEPLSGPFNETLIKDAPLFLEVRDGVAIPRGRTQPFWLTVNVPKGTVAGLYSGTVTVRTSETVTHLPLRVRVLPFELREADGVTFAMYAGMQEDEAQIRESFADMRAHGLTGVALSGGVGAAMSLVDGAPSVDWSGVSAFERNLSLYAEAGFPRPVLWLMSGDISGFCLKHAELASPEFESMYRGIVEQIVERGRKLGWPEIIFQPIDEPFDQLKLLPETIRLLEILKKIPRLRTELDGINSAWDHFTDDIYSLTDVLVLHDGPWLHRGKLEPQKWEELLNRVRKDAKEVWFYNIELAAWRPEPLRFMYGFGLWKSGATGVVQWFYMTPVDPLRPAAVYEATDTLIFRYPSTPERSGGPTIGYEAIREGIDDYRYLVTLRHLVDEARGSDSAKWAREAEALWRPIQAKLDDATFGGSRGRSSQGVWTGRLEATPAGPRYVSGEHKIWNNWKLEDYQALRLRIAEAIVRLHQSRP